MVTNLETRQNDVVESGNLNWSEVNENVILNESLQKTDDATGGKEKNDESLDKKFDDLYERINSIDGKFKISAHKSSSKRTGDNRISHLTISYPGRDGRRYNLERDENGNYFKYPLDIAYSNNSHLTKKYKLDMYKLYNELSDIDFYVSKIESKNSSWKFYRKRFEETNPNLWDFDGIVGDPIYDFTTLKHPISDLDYNLKFSFGGGRDKEGIAFLEIDPSTKTAVITNQKTNSTKKFDNILEGMKAYYDLLKKS